MLSVSLMFVLIASLHVGVSRGQVADPPAEGKCVNNDCGGQLCCSYFSFCGSNSSYCGVGCRGGPCCYDKCGLEGKSEGKGKTLSTGAIVGIALAAVAVLGIALAAVAVTIIFLGAILFAVRRRTKRHRDEGEIGDVRHVEATVMGNAYGRPMSLTQTLSTVTRTLSLKHSEFGRTWSYEVLHSVTDGFSQELGHGAFGIVYKGTLEDGTEIAVKKLVDSKRDVKDFEAEVKTLGCSNHTNLVALLGFAYERDQFFLIYEYVANRSLDQWIFEDKKADPSFVLPWKTRVDILKGTARGLAYLHEELQRGRAIIHLDIKPQNILLDESFVPKIADFGLAKLLGSVTTHQTLPAGGTMGYMAPEVYVGVASPKMDVHSFGMVLLEVVSGREHVDHTVPKDGFFLSAWAMRTLIQGEELEVVDPLLEDGQFDRNVASRLIWIGLLCLQRDPDERPGMSSVLRMIEGGPIPPTLPPTLLTELEIAERLVRRRPTLQSINLIKISGQTASQPGSDPQSEGIDSAALPSPQPPSLEPCRHSSSASF